MRAAVVRFYFDADVLGLAHTVCRLRPDCTYPGDPGGVVKGRLRAPCLITEPSAPDSEWIPLVAQQRWIAITRDSRISRRPWEAQVVYGHGGRQVTISGNEGTSTWSQLEILMRHWRRIEALHEQPGPFIYTVTRSRMLQLKPRHR